MNNNNRMHGNLARAIHVPLFRPERRPLGVGGTTNEPSRSSGPFLPSSHSLAVSAAPPDPDRSMLPSVTYVFAARVPRRRTALVCLSRPPIQQTRIHPPTVPRAVRVTLVWRLPAGCCFASRDDEKAHMATGLATWRMYCTYAHQSTRD